jgi:hypothetical protein
MLQIGIDCNYFGSNRVWLLVIRLDLDTMVSFLRKTTPEPCNRAKKWKTVTFLTHPNE